MVGDLQVSNNFGKTRIKSVHISVLVIQIFMSINNGQGSYKYLNNFGKTRIRSLHISVLVIQTVHCLYRNFL